ncbi:MAG: hypothetical protein GYA87_06465 [Christensenellaceae bacterium]|nr:hypothetical protein [Christensenellaceae bacterium]
MYTKTLKISCVLPASKNEVFSNLKQLKTLQYIAKPYASFNPVNAKDSSVWKENTVFQFKFKLFCFIPLGIHTINMKKFNEDEIYTKEYNKHVPVWNHRITLKEIKSNKTHYTDEIEIGANWKTMFVYLWAKAFYKHRQKKWLKLLDKAD